FSLSHNYTLLAYKPHYHKSISYLIWIIMRRAITIKRWQVYTGREAILSGAGKIFSEIQEEKQ
ncbi:MAG: hypothetical protein ACEY3K_07925, partial [Wolbachia sp.]